MTIINIIKKSFKNVIETPSITLFLVLFLIFINFLMTYSLQVSSKEIALILSLCTFALMCAFFGGWLQLIKEAHNSQKLKETKPISVFLEGIGKNIVPITFGVIITAILANLTLLVLRIIALKVFGNLDFMAQDMTAISQDAESISKYIQTLTTDQLYTIYGWAASGMVTITAFCFLFMFYTPAIINNEKNNAFLKPIVAIKDSIVFIFKNFLGSLTIFLFLSAIYLALVVANVYCAKFTILSILVLFIYIYFVSFVVMLIFNYYEQKNNSSNGADSFGEDKSIDTVGEEIQ